MTLVRQPDLATSINNFTILLLILFCTNYVMLVMLVPAYLSSGLFRILLVIPGFFCTLVICLSAILHLFVPI